MRDRFILSKGHSCEGYYVILPTGVSSPEELASFMSTKAG